MCQSIVMTKGKNSWENTVHFVTVTSSFVIVLGHSFNKELTFDWFTLQLSLIL